MMPRRYLDRRLRLHLLRAVDAVERHRSLLGASVVLGEEAVGRGQARRGRAGAGPRPAAGMVGLAAMREATRTLLEDGR